MLAPLLGLQSSFDLHDDAAVLALPGSGSISRYALRCPAMTAPLQRNAGLIALDSVRMRRQTRTNHFLTE